MTEQEVQILEAMLERLEKCEASNKLLMDSNRALINSNRVLSDALNALSAEFEHYTDNAPYEICDPGSDKLSIFYPQIKSFDETLSDLLNGNKSLCRFGDGEFACINGKLRAKFTSVFFPELASRLLEVLNSSEDNIMIALADNYGDLAKYSPQSRREIRNYMTPEIRLEQMALLKKDVVYSNAYITRPYMFLYNSKDKMQDYWHRIKTLWDGRNVIIIEGSNTGMGVGNDLLDNCKEIKRIIAPSVDAYKYYETILNKALEQPDDSLFLIALGPAATVLAYDLAKTGRRAIDIGHLDIEYEWMLHDSYRSKIPGKYVNEVDDGDSPEPITDQRYRDQILCEIL